jgi:hypothetical protein
VPPERDPWCHLPVYPTIDSKTTLDGSVTVTWSGWYSVWGVTLNDSQAQTVEVAVTVKPDSGVMDPVYCSTSRIMQNAAKIKEKD